MRKIILIIMLFFSLVFSCQQEEQVSKSGESEVPDYIVAKLQSAGFYTTEGLRKFGDAFIVEYDILITEQQIDELIAAKPKDKSGRVQHYRTTNLVTGTPRTINVHMDPSFGTYMQNAFDAALTRYNNEHIGLIFQRVANANTAHIRVIAFYEVSNTLGISAGFPTGGNPASPIRLNTYFYNNNTQRPDAATTIAHEIGHAVGFRHTDYMDRGFSCSQSGNEGDAGVGAVNIPGTPTVPSAGSWMLACSNNTDRPFTSQDRVALNTVYPDSSIPPSPGPDKLIPNQQLLTNQSIVSSDGRFKLIMQGDGNLVIYQNNLALWSTNTAGKPVNRCVMQGDGNLVLYDQNNVAHWNSGTYMYPGAYLILQSDGNLVIYHNNIAQWNSGTCCH